MLLWHLQLNTPNIDSLAAQGVRFDNLAGMDPERDEAHGIVIGRW